MLSKDETAQQSQLDGDQPGDPRLAGPEGPCELRLRRATPLLDGPNLDVQGEQNEGQDRQPRNGPPCPPEGKSFEGGERHHARHETEERPALLWAHGKRGSPLSPANEHGKGRSVVESLPEPSMPTRVRLSRPATAALVISLATT